MLTTAQVRGTRRFVIIDHQPLVRDRFVARLRRESDIDVVGAGGTAEAAITFCERDHPDVLLLDPFLPDVFTADLITLLRTSSPKTRIIMITDEPNHSSVAGALAAGAMGVLMKDPSRRGRHRTRSADAVAANVRPESVTLRERQVTRLVAAGHTNTEIGARLGLSNNTVKSYLRNAMQKLHARNRAQLVTNARKHGLL